MTRLALILAVVGGVVSGCSVPDKEQSRRQTVSFCVQNHLSACGGNFTGGKIDAELYREIVALCEKTYPNP